MTELRDGKDSLKRQRGAQSSCAEDEVEADELVEQKIAQLRDHVEADEYDQGMEMGESEGAVNVAGKEEQDTAAEEAKHRPKHVEEERVRVDKTSTLPFRSL